MFTALHLEDFAARARDLLTRPVYDYIEGWAGDGLTNRSNAADFDRIRLLPRVMRDVANPDTTTNYLGRASATPMGFSPTAFHQLVHPLGEIATVEAASRLDVPMIVSPMSSRSIEDIAAHSKGAKLWLHTYLFRDRTVTMELVRRAEAAGFEAVTVGMGCPNVGKRIENIRNQFVIPSEIQAANFAPKETSDFNNPIASLAGAELDPSVTWRDLELLCASTRLPIIGKGILNQHDVEPALASGVAGLMVSNHGGRQLDGAISSIEALPSIVGEVAGRAPVFLDSGVRRGTDVLKAIALGADAVFLGRPVLWALGTGGAASVVRMGELLVEELTLAMQLLGCASVPEARKAASQCLRWK